MQSRRNRRGAVEHFVKYQHLKLEGLKEEAQQFRLDTRSYIFREDIPPYPRPEFHVSHLKHDTEREALCQIWKDGGFKDPYNDEVDQLPLVWWSLAVKSQDIQSAETRLLETTFPKQTEESLLEKFATSPAFSEKSRYGSYRFIFPLEEVLTAYSEQFCGGEDPVFRVFKTSLYRQEVMYAVLVHRPGDEKDFEKYPKLPAADDMDAVCAYSDGHFIWRAEAMCGSHWYKLEQDEEKKQTVIEKPYYYVWDHFAVALHVKNDEVLKFDSGRLRENLRFCKQAEGKSPDEIFDSYEKAQSLVSCLWPEWPSPLQEDTSLEQSFRDEPRSSQPQQERESHLLGIHAVLRELTASLAEQKVKMAYLEKENQVKQVAFSASQFDQGYGETGPSNTETTLIFRRVLTNIGNAYNPQTGIFTAPLRGVYHFEWHLYGHGNIAATGVLFRNREHIFIAHEVPTSGSVNPSNGASLLLEAGDQVSVRLQANSRISDNQNHHNTFSGHLIFTM